MVRTGAPYAVFLLIVSCLHFFLFSCLKAGPAGLSAAMELAERGFNVTVFERQSVFGGKARSVNFEGSGVDGRPE